MSLLTFTDSQAADTQKVVRRNDVILLWKFQIQENFPDFLVRFGVKI